MNTTFQVNDLTESLRLNEDILTTFTNNEEVSVSYEYEADESRTGARPVTRCMAYLDAFGKAAAEFVNCSIAHARPLRFCEGCVIYYKKATTIYNDIYNSTGNGTRKGCRDLLLNADRVMVLMHVNKNIQDIWATADCKSCFEDISEDNNGTVRFDMKNCTRNFIELYHNTSECFNISKNTLDSAMIHNVCVDCKDRYKRMNTFFEDLLQSSADEVCMDIVDMMNYTRQIWSNTFHCSVRKGNMVPILCISVFFSILPIAFYLGSKIHAVKNDKKLLKQKRLSKRLLSSYSASINESHSHLENHVH